ncbi:MAG TPA: hypothetical protein VJ752_18895 [Burkholderiaceae bacterium]|nr:hypothetical protein [Burkholderiaceae bacterium]
MPLPTRVLLPLLVAVLSGDALAATDIPYPNISVAPGDNPQHEKWYQQCLLVRGEQAPAADQSNEHTHDCNATDLYYDASNSTAHQSADWRPARQCAFATHDYGVLMMLYANGEGVTRNRRLATKYACSLDSAIAEMEGRVLRLSAPSGKRASEHVDLCDDITSGYMQGVCAAIQERQQEKDRTARLARMVQNWRADELQALQGLKDKLSDFATHRAQDETDLSGTARAALQIEAQSSEYEQFLLDIARIRNCKAPPYKGQAIATLDTRLRQALQDIMKQSGKDDMRFGTVEPPGIERTQQAWLAYRNAWGQLVAVKCPSTDSRPWLAALTARRLAQLTEYAGTAGKNP